MPNLVAEAIEIERPSGLVIPEQRSFTATFTDVEVRDTTDGFQFVGHAAVFDRLSVDLGGFRERIARGAFRKVLDGNPDVRFLLNHDPNFVLARTASGTMELSEDPKGLRVFAEVAPTSYANDIRVLVKRGDLSQMSFGFIVGQGNDKWTQDEQGNVVRTITGFNDLLDASIVTYPAYIQTDASMRSVNVFGVNLYTEQGEVRQDDLMAIAQRIHAGEIEADAEHRSIIDAAFSKTDAISPWMAERVTRSEPEAEVEQQPEVEVRDGEVDLETRKRRLALSRISL